MFKRFERKEEDFTSGVYTPEATDSDKEDLALPEPEVASSGEAVEEDASEQKRRSKLRDLKVELHRRLLEMLNLSAIEKAPRQELKQEISTIVRELMNDGEFVLNSREFEQLIEELIDEVTGLGPLEPLLKDPSITDILVNASQQVFVERQGQLDLTQIQFKDNRHLLRIIDKIVTAVGRRIDESQPWVDARLPDGSRVNALIPPCAVDGPLLSIRKFSKIPYTIEKLIGNDTMSAEMAEFLRAVVATRLNVLVSGGTGSGKTTTLNALSSFVSDRERIVTVEDTAELQLQQIHVARMESRPPNIEGKGEVTPRDLVRNALRMRPDRIIVGEVRGGEVLDMLQAMNTGHEGSMTTIHANTPRDALGRIENMVGMSGIDLPLKSIRAQIAAAVHVIVQVQRMSDGRRRIVSIQEITGMEGDVVSMQEIMQFRRDGVTESGDILGDYVATGVRPKFSERFRQWGIELPTSLFSPTRHAGMGEV